MSARVYDGRHRGAKHRTPKRRRVWTGVALPTAAAVVLTFAATGAAVATSPNSQTSAFGNANALQASSPRAVDPEWLRANRAQETAENALLLARTHAASVARSAERKALAARALKAKKAQVGHSWRLPVTNPVKSSPFGFRWGRLHAGEDYAVSTGTELASMSTGTVVFAGVQGGYGNLVKIRYWDGMVSFYGHMSSISVSEGEDVDPGEIVGLSGNTGHSTGPHLHLEIHPGGGPAIDPLPWLADHKIAT